MPPHVPTDTPDIASSGPLKMLALMQLADSAIPIGAVAHSFGLERLVEDGLLSVESLQSFFRDYLEEISAFEGAYFRAAYDLHEIADPQLFSTAWLDLNMRLDAVKTSRESRTASAMLGRRFLQLSFDLSDRVRFSVALHAAKDAGVGIHHCVAFGLACGELGFEFEPSLLAYFQQSLTGLVSACQRLMPVGQSRASAMLWNLKPAMLDAAQKSQRALDQDDLFASMVDLASMRHPGLRTRLFIS